MRFPTDIFGSGFFGSLAPLNLEHVVDKYPSGNLGVGLVGERGGGGYGVRGVVLMTINGKSSLAKALRVNHDQINACVRVRG